MSFSINFKAKYDEVGTKLATSVNVPNSVREFIEEAVEALAKNDSVTSNGVAVNAYGHLHTGEPGNYAPSNCTIDVQSFQIDT